MVGRLNQEVLCGSLLLSILNEEQISITLFKFFYGLIL